LGNIQKKIWKENSTSGSKGSGKISKLWRYEKWVQSFVCEKVKRVSLRCKGQFNHCFKKLTLQKYKRYSSNTGLVSRDGRTGVLYCVVSENEFMKTLKIVLNKTNKAGITLHGFRFYRCNNTKKQVHPTSKISSF
jgi:hypothetical protein